ncbi:hypothetical protein O5165_26050, partial [Escherichia coli]|nr:hypothetical protein [Escherichia coli]
ENKDEIVWVKELYPEHDGYLATRHVDQGLSLTRRGGGLLSRTSSPFCWNVWSAVQRAASFP